MLSFNKILIDLRFSYISNTSLKNFNIRRPCCPVHGAKQYIGFTINARRDKGYTSCWQWPSLTHAMSWQPPWSDVIEISLKFAITPTAYLVSRIVILTLLEEIKHV